MSKHSKPQQAVGLDLGDEWSVLYVISMETGEPLEEGRVRTTRQAFKQRFENMPRCRVALEVGTHSPWVNRLLRRLGHQVIVANAGRVGLIWKNQRKQDRQDAENLARLARVDPRMLHPIQHRGEQAQLDLAMLRSRDLLVKTRTRSINHVRGLVKAFGFRVPKCSTDSFAARAAEEIPQELRATLQPVLDLISTLSRQIKDYDRRIEALGRQYEVPRRLQQIAGVGPLTSLAYVLILEDPTRFAHSRSVGPYLGLVPKLDQSGDSDPQLRITGAGDELLRRLLVGSAQYILGPFGPECDLRRFGQQLQARGGKIAKKKAVVAVARKLAVLLHHLWITGEDYDPHYLADGEPVAA